MAWEAVWTNNLNVLTQTQQENNVDIIYYYFHNLGWNDMPIAAMLGNMAYEGQMNPAQWENGHAIYNGGFGLSQWTPYTKLSNFLGSGWETNYDGQLQRIEWEADPAHQGNIIPDGQWIPVSSYSNYTFQQFAHDTTHNLQWLVECYEYSYERGTPRIPERLQAAQRWYQYIQSGPTPPTPPTPSYYGLKLKPWAMLRKPWMR